MKYINEINDLQLHEPTVITLGKFDGLHEGHKNLMDTMFSVKKERGYKALIFTFDIQPNAKIKKEPIPVITTNLEKRSLFEDLGVDYFLECPFTEDLMTMSPEAFLAFLVEKLCVKCFVVGEDFHFGYKRSGSVQTIADLAEKYDYSYYIKEKVKYKEKEISSTYIRSELTAGNMATARKLLGYPYFIENEIVHGNHIGSAMGIPTVNMAIDEQKVIPPKGVYVSQVRVDGKTYMGVSNIGNKPTVGENYPTGVETFIFDFTEDLYGKTIRVSFLYYLRPEKKFASLEELKEQMLKDIASAKEYYEDVTKMC